MKNIKGVEEYVTTIAEGRVLVDFWADWCPPCKAMLPLLEELDGQDGVEIVKVDIEDPDNHEIVAAADIQSIPTFRYYNEDAKPDVWVGMFKREDWPKVTKGC